jgi:site-specific recombinase XerD
MIELTFQEFHEQNYDDNHYCLYVMKNGLGDVLYVGISTSDIWERWFSWGGHMTWDGQIIYGESPVGINIEDHLPASLDWNIQLWTLQDCLRFCSNELPEDTSGITVHEIEPIMIQKLAPVLNVTYSLPFGKDTIPSGRDELEQMPQHEPLNMGEEINRFLDNLRCSPRTVFAYRNALEQFVKAVGLDARLDTPTYIQFLISLQDKSPSTQRVYTTAVLKLYRFCRSGDQMELQEATQRYRRKTTKRIVDFNLSAVEKVITYCESLDADTYDSLSIKLEALRDRAFVLTLADTGLRISEACSLRYGDIAWNENRALITGMGSKQTLIRFSNRSIRALTDYLAARALVERSARKELGSQPLFARRDIRASKKSDRLVQVECGKQSKNALQRLA